ncbi:MAG: hypothetical protein L3J05_08865 [Robiginitomaculum sp.]|nr:hypothetical protein [Robiginitomaculum sp.]
MMDAWTLIVTVYLFISIAAIIMTYREQKRSNLKSPLFTLIGYVLCTVWPVTVAGTLVAIGYGEWVGKPSNS